MVNRVYSNKKDRIIGKIEKYFNKYNNYKLVLVKLLWFCAKELVTKENYENSTLSNKLSIGIVLDGGVGDVSVYSIWVKEFLKLFDSKCIDVDIFPYSNSEISEALFNKVSYVEKIYNKDLFENKKYNYDLTIAFRRFPFILYCDHDKLNKLAPSVSNIIDRIQYFYNKNQKFFNRGASNDTQIDLYSICKGNTRIQQPDIDNLLGITQDTKSFLCLKENLFNTLLTHHLENIKYITITRSVDKNYDINSNIRLWDLGYWANLISIIKEKYPNIHIVQLGVSRDVLIDGIDIDLRGKTSFEELKIILKHSVLHIDSECGMVHIKHALYGKSCVLFGQTAIEYLGYENNINLKSDACAHWCEWIVDDWQTHCLRGYKKPPCMTELKPEYVFSNIKPYLDEQINKKEKDISKIHFKDFDFKSLKDTKIVFWGKENLEFAKTLDKSNIISIYDYKLENEKIKEAKDVGILLEYGDIYNIPEWNETCDVIIANLSKVSNKEYAVKEITRIAKNQAFIGVTNE